MKTLSVLVAILLAFATQDEKTLCIATGSGGGMCMKPTVGNTLYCAEHAPAPPPCMCVWAMPTGPCGKKCYLGGPYCEPHYASTYPPD